MIRKKHHLRCLLPLLFILLPSLVSAKDLVLLLSSDSEPYREVEQGIRNTITANQPSLKVDTVTLEALQQRPGQLSSDTRLVITVGTRATRYALQNNVAGSIYACFITVSGFLNEVMSVEGFPDALRGAVVLDQPAERVVRLAKIINPKSETIGTVVNGAVPNRLREFQRVAEQQALELEAAVLTEESNPVAGLKKVFSKSDVFTVIPDKARFNSQTAKWILFLSYRYWVPVIGYSQKYTEAGALVSIYSSPLQVGQDTAERVLDYLNEKNESELSTRFHYSRYFKLSINSKVASSLSLKIGNEEQLKETLHKQYGARVRDEAGLTLEIVR